jgi:hypothetical protein
MDGYRKRFVIKTTNDYSKKNRNNKQNKRKVMFNEEQIKYYISKLFHLNLYYIIIKSTIIEENVGFFVNYNVNDPNGNRFSAQNFISNKEMDDFFLKDRKDKILKIKERICSNHVI